LIQSTFRAREKGLTFFFPFLSLQENIQLRVWLPTKENIFPKPNSMKDGRSEVGQTRMEQGDWGKNQYKRETFSGKKILPKKVKNLTWEKFYFRGH